LAYKDAIFLSPHKLLGGPGSSGILLAKRNILRSHKPQRLGGGIVFFVNEMDHEFVSDKQEREESGTPGIIQDIRAGLVFQLKEAVSCETILNREFEINKKVCERLSKISNLFLLGNNSLSKVPIYSFIIKSKKGKILHFSFVTSLLNDLFGI
jgi:selenocysteine lyase/cysteine desulfurase